VEKGGKIKEEEKRREYTGGINFKRNWRRNYAGGLIIKEF